MFTINWLSCAFLAGAFFLAAGPARAQFTNEEFEKLSFWKVQPLNDAPGDDDLRKLVIERFNANLAQALAFYRAYLFQGKVSPDQAHASGWRLLNSSREAYENDKDRLTVLKPLRELASYAERFEAFKREHGSGSIGARELATQFRVDVDIELLKLKKRAPKKETR